MEETNEVVPITCFYENQNNKGKHNNNNNVSTNRHNMLSGCAEIEMNNEEDVAQMMIKK